MDKHLFQNTTLHTLLWLNYSKTVYARSSPWPMWHFPMKSLTKSNLVFKNIGCLKVRNFSIKSSNQVLISVFIHCIVLFHFNLNKCVLEYKISRSKEATSMKAETSCFYAKRFFLDEHETLHRFIKVLLSLELNVL